MNPAPHPSTDEMYNAVVARDSAFDGVFYTCVKTTGIFCRPGCGAKTPKRENVEFVRTVGEAMRAGYRACKRCTPLSPAGETPAWAEGLIRQIEERPQVRISAADLRSWGVDPAKAARFFKGRFGMTFQAFCRARRVGGALANLRKGATVDRAGLGAGYSSVSGFTEAFERLFGTTPARSGGETAAVIAWVESPLGPLLAGATDEGVCLLEFIDRRALETQIAVLRRRIGRAIVPGENEHLRSLRGELQGYFAGKKGDFSVPLISPGTEFQARVWEALRAIPLGETRSYAHIARAIGQPTATRAVARANGDNRLAILIPCHRVIGSDGTLTGYGGGMWRKQWLLDLERQMTGQGRGLFADSPAGPAAAVPSLP